MKNNALKLRHPVILLILVIFYFSSIVPVYSQLLIPLKRGRKAVTAGTGLYRTNPALSIGIGRGMHIRVFRIINEDITLFVELTGVSNFSTYNYFKFTYGGQGQILQKGSFKLMFRKTFTLVRQFTETYRATYLGGELQLIGGIYKEKFYIAPYLYYGDSFTGYVVKDNNFKNILNDLKTGWIAPHLGVLSAGIGIGRFIRPNTCLFFNTDLLSMTFRPATFYYPFSTKVGFHFLF